MIQPKKVFQPFGFAGKRRAPVALIHGFVQCLMRLDQLRRHRQRIDKSARELSPNLARPSSTLFYDNHLLIHITYYRLTAYGFFTFNSNSYFILDSTWKIADNEDAP